MMRYKLPILLVLVLLLSACSARAAKSPAAPTEDTSATLSAIVSATLSAVNTQAPTATILPDPSATPTTAAPENKPAPNEDLSRMDSQGAVEVDVTPSNLANSADTIDFEVGLNTHSVNLNMDLAKLSTLKTDTGLSVTASSWSGESGGHHVGGTLSFPAQVDGKALLEGAKVLTLVIQNVDASERTFIWELKP